MRKWWLAVAVGSLASAAGAQPSWQTPGEEEADTARQLARAGRCAEALEPFDRAVETRTEDPTLRRDRGLCHERLGHPAPAIEDYRAYLSMAGGAPDTGPIRARLEALEGEVNAGSQTSEAAPPLATTPPVDSARPERDPPAERGGAGVLLGFRIGDRGWDGSGYAVQTTSYGVWLGYSFTAALEADARLVHLDTNVEHTGGVGVSLGGTAKLALDDARQLELCLGLDGGFESQKDQVGTARPFWLVRASPALRFRPLPALVLAVGPELGVGSILRAPATDSDRPDTSVQTAFYGASFEIGWLLGGRQSE